MAGGVQLRIRRGAPHGRHLSEPAWLRWLLIAVVLAFLVIFLVLPLAVVFTDEGYAASVRSGPVGEQLCQQHCPVSHVAHEFPQLCEAETAAISRVLGRHVQRLATIAHGDGVCTTCIPASRVSASPTTQTRTTPEKREKVAT